MKIAMIGQKGIPATYGGIERHVEEIGRRLAAAGHQVDVFCRLHYTAPGTTFHNVRLLRRPSIHTKHFDTMTHVAWATVESMIRPSVFAGLPRLTGARTVVTVHGLDWQREKWGKAAAWLLKQCEGPAAHFPDRTIVVSKTLRDYFNAHHHCDAAFIPNGTNLLPARPARKILQLGLTPGKYVLFVGRLVPEKGVHFLCEAFSKIDTDLKLALAGGASASEDYVKVIKGYESDRIRLLDYVYGEGLEELWSNAYMVVQPSTMEGLSISLLEALSYGRCVLLSDIPENLEVAEECAVPFRSKDVEDLRAKLQMLIGDPALVQSYEAKARDYIRQQYSWDRVAKNTETVYLELLGGGRRRR
jgi:glycosyltransferase involved in cell wall biosynthesis